MEIKASENLEFKSIQPSEVYDSIELDTRKFREYLDTILEKQSELTSEQMVELTMRLCEEAKRNANKYVEAFPNKMETAEAFFVTMTMVLAQEYMQSLLRLQKALWVIKNIKRFIDS